jgi:hypothetical protein
MKKLLTPLLAVGCIFAVGAKNTPLHGKPWWTKYNTKVTHQAQGKTESAAYLRTYSDILEYKSGAYDSTQRNFYTYTSFDSVKTERIQTYDAGMKMFMDHWLVNFTYDASKHKTLLLEQEINGSNLTNLVKDTFAYDTHGNVVLDEMFYWFNNKWKASTGTKNTYTYDANGYITSYTSQYLDTSGSWQNDLRLDMGRGTGGKITYLVASYDNGSGFLPQDSFTDAQFYNNDYNKFISAVMKEDNGAGSYDPRARITGTYDSKGNPLTLLVEQWYNGSQSWGNAERQTWAYTPKGDNSYFSVEYFDITSWVLSSGTADSISYDANGNLIKDEHIVYNDTTSNWDNKLLTVNHFHKTALAEANTVSNSINVYPNPAMDQLHVSIPASEKSTFITMYDLSGKVVYQSQLSAAQNLTIPVSALDKGVYSLRIVSGTEVTNKLVVKQ